MFNDTYRARRPCAILRVVIAAAGRSVVVSHLAWSNDDPGGPAAVVL